MNAKYTAVSVAGWSDVSIKDERGVEVAIVHRRLSDDDALIQKHARLFTAAPEMLAALQTIANDYSLNIAHDAREIAKAAIKKAQGGGGA